MSKYKFNIGDKVKIVKYGHIMTGRVDNPHMHRFPIVDIEGTLMDVDVEPSLIGQTGVVVERTKTQGVNQYALHGPNKYAWYDEEQIERLATEHKS